MTDDIKSAHGPSNAPTGRHWSALAAGLLLVAVAAAGLFGISWLRAGIIRNDSWAGLGMLMVKGDEQERWKQALAISEITLFTWSCTAWVASGVLGLSGLWTAVRLRFSRRVLWTGAVASLLGAAVTIAALLVLWNYAPFHRFGMRGNLLHARTWLLAAASSLPGWLILGTWLLRRHRRSR